MRRTRVLCGLLASVGALSSLPASAGNYVYRSLDVANSRTYGVGINANDQVIVRAVDNSTSDTRAVLFTGGVAEAVMPPVASNTVVATGINDRGLVVGTYVDGKQNTRPFVYDSVRHRSRNLKVAGLDAIPGALNRSAAIVGYGTVGQMGAPIGFVVQHGVTTMLKPPGSTAATATVINDAGIVAGEDDGPDGYTHGFTYQAGAYSSFDPPGSFGTVVNFIGPDGTLAGAYRAGNEVYHGFTLIGSQYATYEHFASEHTAVLRPLPGGSVLGTWQDYNLDLHGFIFFASQFYELNAPGATSTQAVAANQAGSFAGTYTDVNGVVHAFLAICPAVQRPCLQ